LKTPETLFRELLGLDTTLGLARSSLAYERKASPKRRVQIEAAIVELSHKHPRYGYRRVHAMVLRRGPACARRTVQRVRRREGLRVLGAALRVRCPARPEAKIKAQGVNDVWCVDLVFDATRHGVTLKFLTIIDEEATTASTSRSTER
jgi:putative transposase